jgi:hypothetical protein
LLVGTHAEGLQIFDGATMTPLRSGGALTAESRINDLCAAEGGYYAVAVENYGIVFFNADGRMVQTLDRTYDHRLAHVQRLLAARGRRDLGRVEQRTRPRRVSRATVVFRTADRNRHDQRVPQSSEWAVMDGRRRSRAARGV